MTALWQHSYEISSLLTNSRGRLGFYALLQVLQDTAVRHALELNLGRDVMAKQNLFWVLTRQKVEMNHWPTMGQTLTARTWLRVQADGFVVRDFSLHGADGAQWGQATTSWLTLNAETRRPMKIDAQAMLQGIAREESTGLLAPKIRALGSYRELSRIKVRNSDIDGNQHVNNTRYGQWILDALPFDHHKRFVVQGYEVNFLAETHLGDTIIIEQGPDGEWVDFRGVRESEQKTVFTARLRPQEIP